jgi:hypothetical protein
LIKPPIAPVLSIATAINFPFGETATEVTGVYVPTTPACRRYWELPLAAFQTMAWPSRSPLTTKVPSGE